MALELVCPDGINQDGAYRLEWKGGDEGAVYAVFEAGELLYQGPDLATTVTGRQQGSYAYELKVADGAQSVRCDVVVEPHSLAHAFGMFGLGAVVFVCTLIVVIRGHRAHRAGSLG